METKNIPNPVKEESIEEEQSDKGNISTAIGDY